MNFVSSPWVIFSEWVAVLVVLGVTVLAGMTAHTVLKKRFPLIDQMGPSAAAILMLIGLKIALEVAPLQGKLVVGLHNGFYIMAVIVFLNLLRNVSIISLKWSTLKVNHSETLVEGFIPLLRNLITLFIFFSGCIVILEHFGYDVMSLVAALGIGSLAVGLAAKDTLSNMISGFILIMDRNLKPGDRINLAGNVGDVREIGLRSTLIQIPDGNTLIVPNSELVNNRIINLSIPNKHIACSTHLRIPYYCSIQQIRHLAERAFHQTNLKVNEKSLSVYLMSLSDGHQYIRIGFWISDLNHLNAIMSEFHEHLLDLLKQEKIPLLAPVTLAQFKDGSML